MENVLKNVINIIKLIALIKFVLIVKKIYLKLHFIRIMNVYQNVIIIIK